MLKNKMTQSPLTMPAREIIIFHHVYARDLFILHPVPDDHPVADYLTGNVCCLH